MMSGISGDTIQEELNKAFDSLVWYNEKEKKWFPYRVVLKEGQSFSTTTVRDDLTSSQQIKSVLASQIKHIVLKHKNKKTNPQVFSVTVRGIYFLSRSSSSRNKDNIFHESPTIANHSKECNNRAQTSREHNGYHLCL